MGSIDSYFPLLVRVAEERGILKDLLSKHQVAIESGSTSAVETVVAKLALAFPRRKMAELFPRISSRPEAIIPDGPLKVRTSNVLARKSVATWGQLSQLTVDKICRLRNAGRITVRDILQLCCRLSYDVPAMPDSSAANATALLGADGCRNPASASPATSSEGLDAIALIAAWAEEVKGATCVGDVLQCKFDDGGLPGDVEQAWRRLQERPLRPFGRLVSVERDMNALVHGILAGLKEKERVAFEMRVLASEPTRLEDVGNKLEVTRERARQLQEKAEAKIGLMVKERRHSPIVWRAFELRRQVGLRACLRSTRISSAIERSLAKCDGGAREALRSLLLRVAGPYEEREGWLVREDAPVLDAQSLGKLADRYGVLPLETARRWLKERGLDEEAQDFWLEGCSRVRVVGEKVLLWFGSVVDKCIAQLGARGRPISGDELMTLVGEDYNARATMAKLTGDERVMRTSKSEVGLRDWGLEEYSGIATEIAERVDAAGGSVRLEEVIQDLVERFGVRESSVKAYAAAPMFVVDSGWVRRRKGGEPYVVEGETAQCHGVFRLSDEEWSINFLVDADTVRGSGRVFPAPLAVKLGVEPNGMREFNSLAGLVRVGWPGTQFTPSISSLRALSALVGARTDDYLQLQFNERRSEVKAIRVERRSLSESSAREAVALVTGLRRLDQEPAQVVAQAIGVPLKECRRVLVERGDGVLWELLCRLSCVGGGDLEEALEEFGRALEGR